VAPRWAAWIALSRKWATSWPLANPPLGEVETAENRGQQIVEVVRYAASELPDRFHLLRLEELFA